MGTAPFTELNLEHEPPVVRPDSYDLIFMSMESWSSPRMSTSKTVMSTLTMPLRNGAARFPTRTKMEVSLMEIIGGGSEAVETDQDIRCIVMWDPEGALYCPGHRGLPLDSGVIIPDLHTSHFN